MALYISIVKSPSSAVPSASSKTFHEQGGSIGRGEGNDWVLPDPDRFLSSCHCQISGENGQFFLTDLSTNGTFVNNSHEPIGKGGKVPLGDGDEFELGDYKFSASIQSMGLAAGSSPFATSPGFDSSSSLDSFGGESDFSPAAPFGSESPFADPFSKGQVFQPDSIYNPVSEDTDPLAALDKLDQPSSTDQFRSGVFSSNSRSDGANAMNQAVSWPNSTQDQSLIPENWGEDIELDAPSSHSVVPVEEPFIAESSIPESSSISDSPPSRPTQSRAVPASKKRNPEAPAPNKPATASSRNIDKSADSSLVDSLGLGQYDLSADDIQEINQTVGELMRETVSGMMQILRSRASIKNQFRMNVTTIQPIENNPLKFSANVDDALENMFVKKSKAYKQPVDAVREGFQGIAEHQVALLAGIRTAFQGMIESFNPETLEKQFERQDKGTFIFGLGKSRYWNSYSEHYRGLADNMENSFQHLFGDDFVQAYEDQLRKLALARKKDSQ
ncbi:MAG: type VI secretion system FHA domain protein [Cellvibrionaceae bacterium]|jgi:type VI secretion system FHA domain protein